jgi:hypothetical protein
MTYFSQKSEKDLKKEIDAKAKAAKKTEVRKKLIHLISDPQTKRLLMNSMALVFASKGLAIASPWFLKGVVDTMALGTQLNL